MRNLILIKHAAPEIIPSVPSEKWSLSERGRASCTPLAEQLRAHAPERIISSTEPKAAQTAELVATQLKIPHSTARDLHEHDRSNVPHMRSSDFISAVELFFRKPDELVLGRETARQTEARFVKAVQSVIADYPGQNLAVVAHGTVIALLAARRTDRTAFQLWRELGLPSMVVLGLPELKLIEIVARI